MRIQRTEIEGSVLPAARPDGSRQVRAAAVPAPRSPQPDVHCFAELREQLAARAAELQQSVLAAADSARRYDAVGDHLLGGMQWRKAHLDQVRLAELERAYALVDDLSRRNLPAHDQSRPDQSRREQTRPDRSRRDVPGLAA